MGSGTPSMNLSQKISHPDWLPDAMRHADSVNRLYRSGAIPEVLQHTMVSNAADRIIRACYPTRWSLVRLMIVQAIKGDTERIHGILYRFWRYRIQMKSQAADIHRMMTQMCPACSERHTFTKWSEDCFECNGCGQKLDFAALHAVEEEEDA